MAFKNSSEVKPPSSEAPLSEKDFIRNNWTWKSLPFWLWGTLLAVLILLIWSSIGWYRGVIYEEKSHEPFLEVTNREFSVFLWQFPSFLPSNLPKKGGYLPGFLSSAENFNPERAEEFVSAPPDLIFLYHAWHRLLAPDYIARSIPSAEFTEFLEQLPEWQPKNWKKAPDAYVQLVENKKYIGLADLQQLTESELPLTVRQTFQGWKNYFKEGPKINEIHPTYGEVNAFIEHHPTYGRSYWRNIAQVEGQPIAGLGYLAYTTQQPAASPDGVVPNEQLAPFLKVALYNASQAKAELKQAK